MRRRNTCGVMERRRSWFRWSGDGRTEACRAEMEAEWHERRGNDEDNDSDGDTERIHQQQINPASLSPNMSAVLDALECSACVWTTRRGLRLWTRGHGRGQERQSATSAPVIGYPLRLVRWRWRRSNSCTEDGHGELSLPSLFYPHPVSGPGHVGEQFTLSSSLRPRPVRSCPVRPRSIYMAVRLPPFVLPSHLLSSRLCSLPSPSPLHCPHLVLVPCFSQECSNTKLTHQAAAPSATPRSGSTSTCLVPVLAATGECMRPEGESGERCGGRQWRHVTRAALWTVVLSAWVASSC